MDSLYILSIEDQQVYISVLDIFKSNLFSCFASTQVLHKKKCEFIEYSTFAFYWDGVDNNYWPHTIYTC